MCDSDLYGPVGVIYAGAYLAPICCLSKQNCVNLNTLSQIQCGGLKHSISSISVCKPNFRLSSDFKDPSLEAV